MLSAGETQTFSTPSAGASHDNRRPSGDNFAPKNVGLSNSLRRGMRGRADISAPVNDGSRMQPRSSSSQRSIPSRVGWCERSRAGGGSLRQLWGRALLRDNRRLDRCDRGLVRRGWCRRCGSLRRQIFRHDGGIERGYLRVRQAEPGFILAEQRDSPIAAHRERLTVRADAHLGFINLAVARIENVAVLIFQAVALHVPDKGNSEQRRVLAVVGAFRAALMDLLAGLRERLGDHALEDALVVDYENPHHGLAVLDLLPQPGSGRLRRLRRKHEGEQHGENSRNRQRQPKSGFSRSGFGKSGFGKSGFSKSGFSKSGFGKSGFGSPHHHHLTSPSSDGYRIPPFGGSFQCTIPLSGGLLQRSDTVTNVP